MPMALISMLLQHMLWGLDHMHEYDYVHLDVKPANLLLDAEVDPAQGLPAFTLKVADLGFAQCMHGQQLLPFDPG